MDQCDQKLCSYELANRRRGDCQAPQKPMLRAPPADPCRPCHELITNLGKLIPSVVQLQSWLRTTLICIILSQIGYSQTASDRRRHG